MSSAEALEELASQLRTCSRCRLNGYPCVGWEGDPNPFVVVVGEAPGNEEAVAGRPFIGKSGHLVRDLLDRLSCSHYITNSVKCHPPRNKTPDDIMVAACRYYLRRELKETKPAIIVTFGNTAYKSVTGEDGNLALIGEQGMKNGSVIYHMPHPAYILRNPHSKTVLWDEPMEKLIELSKRLKR